MSVTPPKQSLSRTISLFVILLAAGGGQLYAQCTNQCPVIANVEINSCVGVITIGVTGDAPFTYEWKDSGGNVVGNSFILSGLAADDYSVTVTDADGDTETATYTVTNPPNLVGSVVVNDVTCRGDSDAQVVVTMTNGSPDYSWELFNGGGNSIGTGTAPPFSNIITLGGLGVDNYTLTVTDDNGCTGDITFTITEPADFLNYSIGASSDATCFNSSDGSLSATGTGGWGNYVYEWVRVSDGVTVGNTATVTGLAPGDYQLILMDRNGTGCTVTSPIQTIGSPPEIVPSASITDALCNGTSTGAINLSVSGGVAPYSYSWSNGATTQDISGLAAGSYTVIITDNAGCTDVSSYVVDEPSVLTLSPNVTDVACFGDATGVIESNVSGGTAPYTYSWSTGATSADISSLAAGTYNLTVTDANGCSVTQNNIAVSEPAMALSKLSEATTNPSCAGGNDGSVTINMQGGTRPYAYSWSNGDNTATASNLTAGLHTVTVTDNNGCTYFETFTLTDPPSIIVTPTLTEPTCNGAADGEITVSASNGTGPYVYNWSHGPSGATINGLTAGTYTVEVIDQNGAGCSVTEIITLGQPAVLNDNAVVNDISCNGANDGSISLAVTGGTGPYTYSWSTGATTNNISGLSAGPYSVTIEDDNGCSIVRNFTIVDPPAIGVSHTQVDILCKGASTGEIDITPSGGTAPYTYSWSNGSTAQDLVNVVAGSYTVTVTDDEGCSVGLTVTLTEPATVMTLSGTETDGTCAGSNNGSIDLTVTGGSAPYTYSWNTGATTEDVTNLAPGNYSVSVTDAVGCIKSIGFTISEPTPISVSETLSDVTCNGAADGTITLNVGGGNGPYTYSWADDISITTKDRTGLGPGNYTVTVTDASGCIQVESFNISEPAILSSTATQLNVSCFGESTGSINLSISGGSTPYTFLWSNGALTEDLTNIPAGNYSVTITDANGCTDTQSFTITEPPSALAVASSVSQITCNGAADGIINLTVSGGSAPYSYNWSHGSTTEDLSNLAAGNYTVTVTDNNGCSFTDSFTITDPPALTLSGIVTDVDCNAAGNGEVDITVGGGEAPYTFSWSNGETTEDISNLGPGNYTVNISDARGCTTSASYVVTEPTAIAFSYTSTNVSCFGNNDGAIDISVSGGSGPYTFNWSNGETTEDINTLAAGNYTLTVTDLNGCTYNETIAVTEPVAALSTTATVNDISCFGGSDGSIQLTPAGGTAPYTYAWNTGATTKDIFGLADGTYQVTITDANGCFIQESYTINMPTAMIASGTQTNILCNGDATGAIDLTVSGGTTPYTFTWSNGDNTEDLSNITAGNYQVTIADASGCSLVRSFTITEPLALLVGENVQDVSCFGVSDGFIDLSVSGGITPYTYSWSNGATTQDLFNISGGNYSVTITDGNGCVTTRSYTINEPTAALAVSGSVTDEICFGDNQGAIALTVTGGTAPYTYNWNQGSTTKDIAGLGQGGYQVVVTDANGCSVTSNYTVSGPVQLSVSAVPTQIDCNGAANGALDLTASGGTAPYTYAWSNGETTEDISALAPGNYSVTITDANGCTQTGSWTITQPLAVTIGQNITDVSCFGAADGAIDLTVSGGIAPYTYSWSNGATTQDISGISGGNYSVTITDANGCVSTGTYAVAEPSAALAAAATVTDEQCFGDSQGAISLTVTGGTAPYTYSWNQGSTTKDLTGLSQGTYQVLITDANGCFIQSDLTVGGPTALTVTGSTTQISCNGAADGAIDIEVNGGTAPYTFAWGHGATSEDLSSLNPGNYSVLITDANGCSLTRSYTISQPAAIGIASSVTDVSCFGAADGAITITVSGGTLPYTYAWSNGETTKNISTLSGGNYDITVTDGNGCTFTQTIAVTEPSAPLSLNAVITDEQCFGDNQGGIDLTVSGGTGPYTYSWNNGSSSEDILGLERGDYQVTVIDNNGCSVSATYNVAGPDVLAITSSITTISCNGADDGELDITVSGGTGPYTYQWSNGASVEDISGLAPGSYSLTVIDANGCSVGNNWNMTEPLPLTINNQINDVTCFGADDGSVQLTVSGGTLPYSYSWDNGATTRDISGLAGGTYEVTVTDARGCQQVRQVVVDAPSAPLTASAGIIDAFCNGQPTGKVQLTVTGGTGPFNYAWSNGSNQRDLVNVFAGDYSVTITDAKGCTLIENYTIGEPDVLDVTFDVTNSSCLGDTDGAVTVTPTGGTAPYNFVWSNGSTSKDLSNIAGGTYNLTITDANGCSITRSVEVGDAKDLNVDMMKFDVLCKGEATGVINLDVTGGSGSYTFAWSNGASTADLSGLTAGVYSADITDSNGCGTSITVVISEPSEALSVFLTDYNDLLCFGDDSGTITAIAQGGVAPYTYLWSNGSRTSQISGLTAGDYTVSVTDANGCLVQSQVTISQPDQPITISSQGKFNLNCMGDSDGRIVIDVEGGTGLYEFLWSTGATTSSIENLRVGDYTVRVKDGNGCVQERVFTISQPEALSLEDALVNESQCYDDRNGSIDLNLKGGVEPYSYQWSTGATTKNLIGISSGSYSVLVTDANGCQVQGNYNLADPALFKVEPQLQEISCIGANDGSISLNIEGGIEPLSIRWSNGASSETITGLGPGEYNVLITDDKGCTIQQTFNIIEPLDLTLDAYIEEAARCNDPFSGRVNVIVSGGTAPYTYRWSNGATTSEIKDVLPGTYVVTVRDRYNCEVQGTYTVLQPEPLQIGLSTEPYIDCNNRIAGVRVMADVKGGVGNYTYNWSKGNSANNEVLLTEPGRLSIEVLDDRGCFQTNAISIDIPELGLADFIYTAESIDRTGDLSANDPVSFFDQSVGEVVDWYWDFGDGFDSDEIDPIHTYDAPGQYTVKLVVTDRTGCQTEKISNLEITEGYRIIIPNAFTPNGDGNNDFFRPRMLGLVKSQLIIYNTWGEVIFSTDDIDTKGWDGTIKGRQAENGNYVYKIIGVSFNGLKVEREGIFALIN
ncbi:PKD domain-containing protein [Roseivirga sp.]|uniref:PKD domain-containing protein n=1 Tax=Roseivirga sp. TaxID=1964215 RepID=UPI003B518CD8